MVCDAFRLPQADKEDVSVTTGPEGTVAAGEDPSSAGAAAEEASAAVPTSGAGETKSEGGDGVRDADVEVGFTGAGGAAGADPGTRVLSIRCCTWNVGNKMPSADFSPWIPEGGGDFDVIAVGLQESTYKIKSKKTKPADGSATPAVSESGASTPAATEDGDSGGSSRFHSTIILMTARFARVANC